MRHSSLTPRRGCGPHALSCRAAALSAMLALAGCGGDAIGPGGGSGPGAGSAVTIAPEAAAVAVGGTRQLVATPEGGSCSAGISWRSSDPSVASVSAGGLVTGLAAGPAVTITATCADGPSGIAAVAVTTFAATAAMLNELPGQIASSLTENQSSLPRNPRWAEQINAKIALLQRPGLATAIVRGGYLEASARTRGGTLPLALIFAVDTMRPRAEAALDELKPTPAILEEFFDQALPLGDVRVWYGFQIGNMGGGGSIWTEDQGTYDARRVVLPTMMPFFPVLHHELGHSFIGHEALTQFLEIYAYNMIHTGSRDPRDWTYTRGYRGLDDANTGVFAVLDIRGLIGHDATARAYRTLYTLRPAYGQPLSAEAQQAFVDQAPPALKAQVAAKAAKI